GPLVDEPIRGDRHHQHIAELAGGLEMADVSDVKQVERAVRLYDPHPRLAEPLHDRSQVLDRPDLVAWRCRRFPAGPGQRHNLRFHSLRSPCNSPGVAAECERPRAPILASADTIRQRRAIAENRVGGTAGLSSVPPGGYDIPAQLSGRTSCQRAAATLSIGPSAHNPTNTDLPVTLHNQSGRNCQVKWRSDAA